MKNSQPVILKEVREKDRMFIQGNSKAQRKQFNIKERKKKKSKVRM